MIIPEKEFFIKDKKFILGDNKESIKTIIIIFIKKINDKENIILLSSFKSLWLCLKEYKVKAIWKDKDAPMKNAIYG